MTPDALTPEENDGLSAILLEGGKYRIELEGPGLVPTTGDVVRAYLRRHGEDTLVAENDGGAAGGDPIVLYAQIGSQVEAGKNYLLRVRTAEGDPVYEAPFTFYVSPSPDPDG